MLAVDIHDAHGHRFNSTNTATYSVEIHACLHPCNSNATKQTIRRTVGVEDAIRDRDHGLSQTEVANRDARLGLEHAVARHALEAPLHERSLLVWDKL